MLLHAQIEANKRKTWVLVTVFLLLFVAVGAAFGVAAGDDPLVGLVVAAVLGVIYVLLVTRTGTQVVMAMNRAREVKSEDENPFLWNTVEALSIAARLPMPKVYIIDDPSPNAFAAGMTPENAAVAVTTGLLERLNRQEIEGVLAHEVAHIQNYDVRLATTAVALVAVIGILSDLGMRMLWWSGGRRRRQRGREGQGEAILLLVAVVLLILAPLAAVLVQLAISRNREYLADASGAELCRNPGALASALRKIAAVPEPVRAASASCAALYISDPMKRRSWAHLFATHPPVEERIRRLEQMM